MIHNTKPPPPHFYIRFLFTLVQNFKTMEENTDTKNVLLQSDEILKKLIHVTGKKLVSLEKLTPNDVQTRVRFKEMERNAISMQKHINDILETM